jgi:hypothetical protein
LVAAPKPDQSLAQFAEGSKSRSNRETELRDRRAERKGSTTWNNASLHLSLVRLGD